jgi:hypothetical protein
MDSKEILKYIRDIMGAFEGLPENLIPNFRARTLDWDVELVRLTKHPDARQMWANLIETIDTKIKVMRVMAQNSIESIDADENFIREIPQDVVDAPVAEAPKVKKTRKKKDVKLDIEIKRVNPGVPNPFRGEEPWPGIQYFGNAPAVLPKEEWNG